MLLEADDISVAYDGAQVLWDVSIAVGQGEVVALLGPNGSGKSTLMNSISRLVALKSGRIVFAGREIQREPPYRMVQLGLCHVLERHRLFPYMTVLENLQLGAGPGASRDAVEAGLERAHQLFPILGERSGQIAGSLSGGEQQMCAIARGLMAGPRLLLVDEPFIGLSPKMRGTVERALRLVSESGVSILLIEQNVREALRMSSRAYVLRTGRVVVSGASCELAETDAVKQAFMGGAAPAERA
jgi:branched-chain amino acid transport system ATP-binding protein